MKKIKLPIISKEEHTPHIQSLMVIIEELSAHIHLLEENQQRLKDEIAILKGEKERPTFKPSKMDEETDKNQGDQAAADKRPGSKKRSKTQQLQIHEEKIIQPTESIPEGSRFKGYRNFVVQDLVIHSHNTCYRLARWQTPDGEYLIGKLPDELKDRHFGNHLTSYILYQHHHCQVTQPLLLEQLREWGIDMSTGELNRLLLDDHEPFHVEKGALLTAGLSASSSITVDDTGTRHQGKNGYVTQIGNDFFAWFESTESKSRINFLGLLRAGQTDYQIEAEALYYMEKQKLPKMPLDKLRNHPNQHFADQAQWGQHLDQLGVTQERHRRIATEGALIGSVLKHGFSPDLAIISDDAGQFNVFIHGLCWVHAERLVHKLIPLNDDHRESIDQVRDQIWTLYADLKAYKKEPNDTIKSELDTRFDEIFTQKTCFETLNQTLKRIHKNKSELLLVLDRPDVPLHTNGSEQDIRDYVKKKKVSGGTRSQLGRQCRDTFASLKKTCRKLGISFWKYLTDRVTQTNEIPPLPEIVRQRASPS
jgi:hypothetical protein